MPTTILLVEDDPAVSSSVSRRLRFEGYQVETAFDGATGLEKVRALRPDLVILDVMLPGLDGFTLCNRIREESDLPILMLTARGGVADRVAGFERGADDYLVKPFAIEELTARIRALLRRAAAAQEETEQAVLAFSDLELNPSTREVFRGRRPVELTAREFSVLEYLLRNPRQVLTRDQIFERVWGSEHLGESNVIDVNVRALRAKLEAAGEGRLIQTVRGLGYSLREA